MSKQNQQIEFMPRVENPRGTHPIVLVCEHASPRIPEELDNLGLDPEAKTSHIAWDPGAFETAKHMSALLNAPLVYSTTSRLVYDCNRPPDAASAMPERSEATDIPGNRGLTDAQRQARVEAYYRPFETLLSDTLDHHNATPILVTLHSFTPVYHGRVRAVEIGILHDRDSRLADAILHDAADFVVERNAPYGPEDGVTHTLKRHALSRGILNVMIEVRNDLIDTPETCAAMANTLTNWLLLALDRCAKTAAAETTQ